jgi:ribosome-associated protein
MKQNSSTPEPARRPAKERATAPPSPDASSSGSAPSEGRVRGLDERISAALHAASDKKGLDIVALDLRAVASFTDYFLITSGTNARQVQAIADEVVERLKKQGTRAARVEGYSTAEWVLLDYGDFIVHVFEDKARRFYDLERLWRDAARVELPAEITGGGTGSLRNEQ